MLRGGEQYKRKESLLCDISWKNGQEYYEKQKYGKAVSAFTEALRHVPDDVKSLVWRSRSYSKLRRIRRATDDVNMALTISAYDKEALLQKGDVLDQAGNHEMALVYYHRGSKQYPKTQEFKDRVSRTDKRTARTGRRMKMTAAGDITYFTQSHKSPPPKNFSWKQRPKDKVSTSSVPSASFRTRLVHPLVNFHRAPSVNISESRATSLNSLMAGSLEALSLEGKLIEETTEKDILGKMYEDKEYLEFLLGSESVKTTKTPLGKGLVMDAAVNGLSFLQERTQFWDKLGPLPPPHPSKTTNKRYSNKSRLSNCTSTESINSTGTFQSNSSMRSFGTNASYKSKRSSYRSRYAFVKRKEKPIPPNPEKVKFDFATYQRHDDGREMTEIPEENVDKDKVSEAEKEREKNKTIVRGEEVTAFVQKEVTEIDRYYGKGQLDVCKKRADACIDVLGRYTDEEVPTKNILLSTLYSCLGNCDMQTRNFASALENHGHDLMIGEQIDSPTIQSRALGNLGRVHVLMGKYNRALDLYNRKAPLCTTPRETAWLFHEIGNCFLMIRIYEYALESGVKALQSANKANDRRLQLQTCVLVAVSEVNLMRYKEAYQHFDSALQHAKILDDKNAQDAMTKALVDVNKKMVQQMKKHKTSKDMTRDLMSPVPYNVTSAITPVSRTTPLSARTNVTAEG